MSADPFDAAPFSFARRDGDTVDILYRGKVVKRLRPREGARFLARIQAADAGASQRLMAIATGNFKRGNERTAKAASKGRHGAPR